MKWHPYLIFTMVTGMAIGYFSMISDTLPYQDRSAYDIVLRLIAELFNDTITWLALATLVGYLFCHSNKRAALAGAGFAVFAIATYLAFGFVFPPDYGEGYIATHSWSNEVLTLGQWFAFSILGGAVGGLVGFAARRRPAVLFVLVAFIVARLIMRGPMTWQTIASMLDNVIFIGIALVSVVYVITQTYSRHGSSEQSNRHFG